MDLFSRLFSRKSKRGYRTVQKKTVKFKDGSRLYIGTVRVDEPIKPAKRVPRDKYYDK